MWQRQASAGRDFYLGLSNDDILHGYRVAAGAANAPGRALGGWCSPNSNTVFGQWLQSMARMQRAYGDKDLLDKANILVSEYAKCWPGMSSGAARGSGRGAIERRDGRAEPLSLREAGWAGWSICITMAAIRKPWRCAARSPKPPPQTSTATASLRIASHGNCTLAVLANGTRWPKTYTAPTNLPVTRCTRSSATCGFIPAYWDKFAETADPKDAQGVHAYSHCNTFSSAALAYDVTGDARYLRIMKNFYDWMQRRQTYATGGYGPDERFVYSDGALGDSLEIYSASFECPCDSWAAFKLSKYLMLYTGEARYGDWIERLLYNGIGAALPIKDRGVHMYYMDYHLGSDLKYYSRNAFTCCSGTYFQNITEYSNLIYFRDANSLFVNLYVPSEVEWKGPAGTVKVTQTTEYPEAGGSTLKLAMDRPATFTLKLRVPGWSNGMTVQVNGQPQTAEIKPGQWAAVTREWQPGDGVEVKIPLRFRRAPIDEQHPNRIAIMRGPVVYGQEDPHKWLSDIPRTDDELDKLMKPLANSRAIFQIDNEPVVQQRNAFKPFYSFNELERYRMYFDSASRRVLW